jgi:subtilisin family serine protease
MTVAGHRSRSASFGRVRLLAAVTVVITASVLGSPRASAVDPTGVAGPAVGALAAPGPTKTGYSKLIQDNAVLQPGLAAGSGRHTVFVQLATRGAAAVSAAALARNQGAAAANRAVQVQRAKTRAMSIEISDIARGIDPSAVTIFQVANAVPGVGLTADSAALHALAGLEDVVRISEIVPKMPANAGAVQLTRALQAWTDLGVTGHGERIGVIDTGIDYTHADFGGPGTAGAYRAARATDTAPWTPTAKVVGGFDFVGDDYDAAATTAAGTVNPDYQPVPHPDPNPLDCNGHGTHVAGTVAGTGVDAGGRTFTGDYRKLTGAALYGMDIGPGVAPQAALYALKVFGCSGATDQVIPALDRALDPDGDGDFADHLDVVDLSLANPIGAAGDPETTVLDTIAEYGVLPVVAAGNGGDQTDAAGSLTGSVRSIAVASSVDAYQQFDGVLATMPGATQVTVAGQMSSAYPWSTSPDISGQVVSLSAPNADGCSPLSTADVARAAGRIVWLSWDDDDSTRACGSVARATNLLAAGGLGVLLTSATPVFAGPVAGTGGLPMVQLTPTVTQQLASGVDHGLQVRMSGRLAGKKPEIDNSITDLIQTTSARGTHGSDGPVKPDVTAPGDTISSALMGSGSGSSLRSGTSMAAAEIAGVAALVRQGHPWWTPEQVKAAVMNTAGHDLYTGPDRSGAIVGPDRAGSGRVDAADAVTTRLLAYSSTTPGAVSVTFGVVTADVRQATVVVTSAVVVQNTGSSPSDLALSYQSVVDQPGVAYEVSPASMTLPAGASALATVTMTVTPSALRHTLDPGSSAQQRNPLTGLDEARQFVPAASGRVLVTAPGVPALRVPVYGVAKPVSSTTATDGTAAGRPALVLAGTGFSLSSPTDPAGAADSSLVSVLNLGYRSRAGDIQAVGAGRVGTDADGPGYLWFGLSTYADWATAGKNMFPTVNIDTNGDNTADYTVQVQAVAGSDLLYAMLFDDAGAGSLIGIYPVNFNLGNVDTNPFDTNVMLIPIDPTALGYRATDTTFPIRYSVATYASYGLPQNSGTIATTPAIAFDVARPAISMSAPLWQDQGGTGIPYQLGAGVRSADALVLHLQGADGARTQVVTVSGGSG